MMRGGVIGRALVLLCSGCAVLGAEAVGSGGRLPSTTVSVANTAAIARLSETIELAVPALKAALAFDDARKVHVADGKTGRDLLTQAVDVDDDGIFEMLIFQSDFAASETKTFTLSVGEHRIPARDEFKAYGRFVRERRDDYAWENDRIAHRTYGPALEAWAREPLTSSAIDIWVKRTRKLIINDWYMVDDYHRDSGDGADLYSAGKTRGCGGNGIWQDGKLYPSANFRESRSLANGPIRVMFELSYTNWDAAGLKPAEVKRITLDAGQNLSRFESFYRVLSPRELQQAVGIKNVAGQEFSLRRELGVMRTWEAFSGDNGHVGCGVVVDPRDIADAPQADGNYLLVTKVAAGTPAVYWAGAGWDRSGDFANLAAWDAYLDAFARRMHAPPVVTIRK